MPLRYTPFTGNPDLKLPPPSLVLFYFLLRRQTLTISTTLTVTISEEGTIWSWKSMSGGDREISNFQEKIRFYCWLWVYGFAVSGGYECMCCSSSFQDTSNRHIALAWRNRSFCFALDFVWSIDGKEEYTFSAERMYGGSLLAMCSNDFICLYDWFECRLIQRIDVNNLYWDEAQISGTYKKITSLDIFFLVDKAADHFFSWT
ncbi:unnamed protein product [Lactuca saligna]|uniref:Uncharacterized protein n=1 Tax=Lactuca saligna TaxID=75948 RepID=A0AA35ZRU3_LACSI|nr:unnamed protein product [Lactuca saligna]